MCQEVGAYGLAVCLLQVELLNVCAFVQTSDDGHEDPVHVFLGPEPLDVFGEEQDDVLHELLPRLIEMSGHLEGAEDVVKELLVEVSGNELEKVLVQEREHLVPHRLVDRRRGIVRDV